MAKKSVPPFEAPAAKSGANWNDTRGAAKSEGRKQKKAPSSASQPIAIDDMFFRFSGADIDHAYDGEWNWDLTPKETRDVLDLLSNCSAKQWREIKSEKFNSKNKTRALNHDQSVESLSKPAKKRLGEIGRGDQESLFRLRHGNLVRIWGVVELGVFKILWFDRNHKVYPVDN